MADEERNLQEEQENEQETSQELEDTQEEQEQEETEETETEETEEKEPDFDNMSDDEFDKYFKLGKYDTDSKEETKEEQEEATKDKAKVISKPEAKNIDYKAVYNNIFKPFKANGKEITPRTTDDVISLMQMGANYTKKMQLMAPMKRAVESLNNAKIGEEDLSFLIDIHKGDKEAIKQLLKKHEIDPMDLDLDEINYKANTKNIASDEDIEFSDALMDSESSLPKIQEILNKKWDKKSKAELLKNPQLMRGLHEEIELGRFDAVQAKLEEERMYGRYKGVDDLHAYIDIVTKMVNAYQKANQKGADKSNTSETNARKVSDKSKAAPVRNKGAKGKSSLTAKDLLDMDEETFMKLSEKDLV